MRPTSAGRGSLWVIFFFFEDFEEGFEEEGFEEEGFEEEGFEEDFNALEDGVCSFAEAEEEEDFSVPKNKSIMVAKKL